MLALLTEKIGTLWEELREYWKYPFVLPHNGLHQGRDLLQKRQSFLGIGTILEVSIRLDECL